MGRAGVFQGEVVVKNILAMIGNRNPTATYVPGQLVEGAIKLTLGKVSIPHLVILLQNKRKNVIHEADVVSLD